MWKNTVDTHILSVQNYVFLYQWKIPAGHPRFFKTDEKIGKKLNE